MPIKNQTNVFGEEDVFRLKVAEIVYNVLKDRDLTINEVNQIKEAIQSSLDLVLVKHSMDCQRARTEAVQTILDERLTSITQELKSSATASALACVDAFRREDLETVVSATVNEILTNFKGAELLAIINTKLTECSLKNELKIRDEADKKKESAILRFFKVVALAISAAAILLSVVQLILKLFNII